MSNRITAEDIIALRPCGDWPEERIRALIGEGVTYEQIATHPGVWIAERRWVLTRLAASTEEGRRALVRWAAVCALDVVHLIDDGDTQTASLHAIWFAAAWADGDATRDECLEISRAAYDPAYAAARAASYAAQAAAEGGAWSPAYAAAYAAYAARREIVEQHLINLATALEAL